MVETQQESQHGKYYPGISGVRTLAVALTILFHAGVSWAGGGFLGVDLFFVISGFVITLTLLREHERVGYNSLRAFYRRRFWRLTPALVTMVVFAAIIELGSRVIGTTAFAREALFALSYTYNLWQVQNGIGGTALNHTWSLGVEEQFYLGWAPLAALLFGAVASIRRRAAAVVAFVLAGLALQIATASLLGTGPAFLLPWCRFDELLLGALLAVVLYRDPAPFVAKVLGNQALAVAALVGFGVLVDTVTDLHAPDLANGGFMAIGLLGVVLVGHVYVRSGEHASLTEKVLASAPMRWLGDRSYGIYLYHYPIMFALRHHDVGTIWKVIIAGGGAVVAAALSYRFVETPLRRRGHNPAASVPGAAGGAAPRYPPLARHRQRIH